MSNDAITVALAFLLADSVFATVCSIRYARQVQKAYDHLRDRVEALEAKYDDNHYGGDEPVEDAE